MERIMQNASGHPVLTTAEIDLEGLGNITIGTTEVEIEVVGITAEFRIQADSTNTGVIYIGKTGVLSNGTNDFARLSAGEEISIKYNDFKNPLYAISNLATQKINVGVLISV